MSSALLAFALAALGLGIGLIAQPGHGWQGNLGWALTIAGVGTAVAGLLLLVLSRPQPSSGAKVETASKPSTVLKTESAGSPAQQTRGDHSPAQSASAQRDSIQAARDVTIIQQGFQAQPDGSQRLRLIADEIRHIKRRFAQLDQQREEWSSIWPGTHAPYQPLPSEKWNLYGAALQLPQADHDLVQEAYELANDFNHHMLRGPSAFGDPEPDLEGVRRAFDEAEQIISALAQPASLPTRGEGETSNPFAQARKLQDGWRSEELGAALLEIRQELVVNQRRLRALLRSGSTQDFRGFPSARWSDREDLIRRRAPNVCVLADQAYGLIIELRDLGIEDEKRPLEGADREVGEEALGLFQQTIAAIDRGRP